MALERPTDGEEFAPERRSLLLLQLRRLGDVPSAPDHDRVPTLDPGALEVGVGDVARQDPEAETSLLRPPLGTHGAAFASTQRVELDRPLHGRILGATPETPEQFWERARDHLQAPTVHEWDTWPFDGPVQPKALEPPVEREKPRHGAGGVDCHACAAPDDYGEGGEHLHIWFMGRPARMEQLRSSFAAIWDDVLPPTPEDIWRGNSSSLQRRSATNRPRTAR